MGKNILSIDDDEDILYTIQEIILHQGWTPLLARNFREAEHILTQYGNGRLDRSLWTITCLSRTESRLSAV